MVNSDFVPFNCDSRLERDLTAYAHIFKLLLFEFYISFPLFQFIHLRGKEK